MNPEANFGHALFLQVHDLYYVGTEGYPAFTSLEAQHGAKWRHKFRQRFAEVKQLAEAIQTVQSVLRYQTMSQAVDWWTLREKHPLTTLSKVGQRCCK
jgi:uncharacterized membrane protein YfbV (UPF0208 family)